MKLKYDPHKPKLIVKKSLFECWNKTTDKVMHVTFIDYQTIKIKRL